MALIGKGDPNERTGRDFEYRPTTSSPFDPPGSSQVTDCYDISKAGDSKSAKIIGNSTAAVFAMDEWFKGNDMFKDEDIIQALLLSADSTKACSSSQLQPLDESIETPSDYESYDDSLLQSTVRISTKLRAATLGYLWQFADSPADLRREFRRLRQDRAAHVLHLCGCGMSYYSENIRVFGCMERSHLRLGTVEENARHLNWHMVMSYINGDNYAKVCSVARESDLDIEVF